MENNLKNQSASIRQLFVDLCNHLVSITKFIPIESKNRDAGFYIGEPFFISSFERFQVFKIDTFFTRPAPLSNTFESDFRTSVQINDQIRPVKEISHVQIK